MKIIALFNNKGGVGKSTLAFHVGCALNELGFKTLLVDLDPQCNLTINGIDEESLHKIWKEEDRYIDDFEGGLLLDNFTNIINLPRSIHFLLKPVEDGVSDFKELPPLIELDTNLDLLPGRLSIHKYENKLAERWSGAYQGDNLSIRTITNIRNICRRYSEANDYDYIIIDTSPSLGILNKTIISTVDGFMVPAQPDMFSLYGIRNIGNALELWSKEFNIIYSLISTEKRKKFPEKYVQFIGYNIYNAKPYSGLNEYDLSQAHYDYVKKIPDTIKKYIKKINRTNISDELISKPIGDNSIMHTHNTYPSMSQKYKCPIWKVPDIAPDVEEDPRLISSISGNRKSYYDTKEKYFIFSKALIERINTL